MKNILQKNKRKIGSVYEEQAIVYLQKLGYQILEHNFNTRYGEIDLIALDGQTLVFVEVKYRSNLTNGYPQEAVTAQKRARIIRAARFYLYKKGKVNVKCRFDVVAILGEELTHIIDAFTV